MTILRERQPSFLSMHRCGKVRALVVEALGVAEGAAIVEVSQRVKHGDSCGVAGRAEMRRTNKTHSVFV